MAIEVWGRWFRDGLESVVLSFVDEREAGERAQVLLVCAEVDQGQLIRPAQRPPVSSAGRDTEQRPPSDPDREEFPILDDPPRPWWRFWLRLEELDEALHVFDVGRLYARALLAAKRGEDPVSLNPANREEWGYIETLPSIPNVAALASVD
jgi:hypothetical protein